MRSLLQPSQLCDCRGQNSICVVTCVTLFNPKLTALINQSIVTVGQNMSMWQYQSSFHRVSPFVTWTADSSVYSFHRSRDDPRWFVEKPGTAVTFINYQLSTASHCQPTYFCFVCVTLSHFFFSIKNNSVVVVLFPSLSLVSHFPFCPLTSITLSVTFSIYCSLSLPLKLYNQTSYIRARKSTVNQIGSSRDMMHPVSQHVTGHVGYPMAPGHDGTPPNVGNSDSENRKHDITEILTQIINITDQSLDEAQARCVKNDLVTMCVLLHPFTWDCHLLADQLSCASDIHFIGPCDSLLLLFHLMAIYSPLSLPVSFLSLSFYDEWMSLVKLARARDENFATHQSFVTMSSLFSPQETHLELSSNEASSLQCPLWNQGKDRWVTVVKVSLVK